MTLSNRFQSLTFVRKSYMNLSRYIQVTTESFDLQTSCNQKQCNFLIYVCQNYDLVDYVSIFVCNRVRVTFLLSGIFILIHDKTKFLHHLKVHQ